MPVGAPRLLRIRTRFRGPVYIFLRVRIYPFAGLPLFKISCRDFRGYVYCAIVVRDPRPTEKNMKKGTCSKPASPLAADRILGLDRSVLPVRWSRPSLSSPTPPSPRLPLQAEPYLARSRLAGRSARGDCTCAIPAYGAPADVYRGCRRNRRAAGMLIRAARRGGYEGGGGGQGRRISWFWSGICALLVLPTGNRPRGDAFCPVVAGYPAMAGSVLYFAGW
jgi:hypothetical protein